MSGQEHAVLVSCDLVGIPDDLRDAVRLHLRQGAEGLDPMKVVLRAYPSRHYFADSS